MPRRRSSTRPRRRSSTRTPRRFPIVLVLAGLVLASLAGIWFLRPAPREDRASGPAEPSRAAPAATPEFFPDGRPRYRAEFERLAARLTAGNAEFFGRKRLYALRTELLNAGLGDAKRVELIGTIVRELLRQGETGEAVERVEELFQIFDRRPDYLASQPNFHRLRGQTYLRQAEVENCVRRHNEECCLLPLRGAGVHEFKEPAAKARESYLRYLEKRPGEHGMRWLLNICAMALGEVPSLPAHLQFPSDAFDSDYDVGRFRDVAPRKGLDTLNLCGGVIVDDFDGDGWLDIVTSTIDPSGPLRYFRNRGDGTFEDRSSASRLDDQRGGLNILGADYDSDGDVDVFVLRGAWMYAEGRIRNSLLRNEGDGTFTDVTREAGVAEPAVPTQAATFGDFDNDGDLDLFVGTESLARRPQTAQGLRAGGDYRAQLFSNRGDGTFVDVAAEAGVASDHFTKGVTAGDYDNDGDLDLYLSNIGPNQLFRNEGDGTFVDVAPQLRVTEPAQRSFTTWFFDYDNDGWLDLFVGAYSASLNDIAADYLGVPHSGVPPALYHNEGDGTFTEVAAPMGIARPFLPMGANFGDLDNDGYLDFYLATGEPSLEMIVPNVMFRNDGGRAFQDVTTAGGFGHLQKGHGVAFADVDNDGDQDVFEQLGGFYPGDAFHNALFENPGHGQRFLCVKLVGTRTNRGAHGARLRAVLRTPGGRREIHRAVGSVSSFGGSPARQELGLGDAIAIERLEVHWPVSGESQAFTDVPLDSFIEIIEGGTWRPI